MFKIQVNPTTDVSRQQQLILHCCHIVIPQINQTCKSRGFVGKQLCLSKVLEFTQIKYFPLKSTPMFDLLYSTKAGDQAKYVPAWHKFIWHLWSFHCCHRCLCKTRLPDPSSLQALAIGLLDKQEEIHGLEQKGQINKG